MIWFWSAKGFGSGNFELYLGVLSVFIEVKILFLRFSGRAEGAGFGVAGFGGAGFGGFARLAWRSLVGLLRFGVLKSCCGCFCPLTGPMLTVIGFAVLARFLVSGLEVIDPDLGLGFWPTVEPCGWPLVGLRF